MIITRTPLRISFFGGGTDYPVWYRENGGAVLSTSIDKYCYISCRYLPPFFEHKTRLVWSRIEQVKNVDELAHPAAKEVIKFLGIDKGLEIHYDADLPSRGGLGSSSAFAVGLLHALYTLLGEQPAKRKLALEAIHIEQELIKENVGSQDQVVAAFGGLNKIEFGGPEHIRVSPLSLPKEKLQEFEKHIMIFFTGLARNASDVAAEQVKLTPQKEKELQSIRKMVEDAVFLLKKGDFGGFGKLLHEHWQIKRTLSSQITNKDIDEIYEAGKSAGAWGGKLLGAGSGGFMIFFVEPERQAAVKEKLKNLLCVPVRLENSGSQVIFINSPGHNS